MCVVAASVAAVVLAGVVALAAFTYEDATATTITQSAVAFPGLGTFLFALSAPVGVLRRNATTVATIRSLLLMLTSSSRTPHVPGTSMNLARYRGAWSKVVSYAAFFASSPGHIPALLRGARYRAGFHVGELIKIARMRPALDVGTIGTIIDVGANRGQFSLTARMLAPSIRIVAVEPLPACAMFLRHAIGQGRGRVIEMAAGMEEGEVQFYEAAVDKSSSTLVMTELHHAEFPWTGVSASSVVRQGRLDSMIDVDELVGNVLLKVDVQGAELAALMSASRLLPRIDAVIVEVDFEEHYVGQPTPDDIVRFLLDSGFHFAGVVELLERHSDGGVVQADLLFHRDLQIG